MREKVMVGVRCVFESCSILWNKEVDPSFVELKALVMGKPFSMGWKLLGRKVKIGWETIRQRAGIRA